MITSQPQTLVRITTGTLVTPALQAGKSDQSHGEGNALFPGSPSLSECKALITSGSFLAAAVAVLRSHRV